MVTNILNTKIELIQWLTTLEDDSIIAKILELRRQETKDWWQMLSSAEKLSIEAGLDDAKKGKLKPNTEAEKIYSQWL